MLTNLSLWQTYPGRHTSEPFLTWAGMREIWNVFGQVVPAFGICCSGQDKLELLCRRGFERLIRKILNLPNRPAVTYFHVWTPRRLGFHFYESPENIIEMVPEYYGLPSISMRNAMYHMVANLTVPADWIWRSDINHANCLGHRCAVLTAAHCLQGSCLCSDIAAPPSDMMHAVL